MKIFDFVFRKQAAESDSEGFRRVTSRLDELNNILAATQKKINNFKVRFNVLKKLLNWCLFFQTSYGSLTNLFKSKVGNVSTNGPATSESNHQPAEGKNFEANEETLPQISDRKADLYNTMDGQVDKLDAMITKAENAHYSMEHQRKQMKKFLN